MKHFLSNYSAVLLAIFLFFLLSGLGNAIAEPKGEDKVCFRWAFGAMVGPENDRRLVAITRDTELKTGDQLKMLVELQKKCFVYVIYHTRQDEVHMLFPYNIQQFTTEYTPFTKYYIPQGNMWFELDENIGSETFYLLASAQRLIKLEALFKTHSSADPVRKHQLGKQIIAEIHTIKRRYRTFTTTAERPVPIGGSVRGITKEKKTRCPDIDPIAAEVSASTFYSRTFTIDHR